MVKSSWKERGRQQQQQYSNPSSSKKESDRNEKEEESGHGGRTSGNVNDDAKKLAMPSSKVTNGICPIVSSRYTKVGRIGEGTYGIVYEAFDKRVTQQQQQQQQRVALKRCIPHHESSDGFPITTLREIQSLKVCCQHPNIVNLLDITVSHKLQSDSGGVFLVFEYCSKDIATILDTHYHDHRSQRSGNRKRPSSSRCSSPFTESQTKTLLRQLLSAIEFCHTHYLIHRDIKPSNLLYSPDGQLKLCDFGLSRHCSPHDQRNNMTPNVVSLWYRAPELLFSMHNNNNTKKYSFPIDLFAIGCVYAELLQGYPLLDGKSEIDQISKMIACLGQPPSNLYKYNTHDMQTQSPSSSSSSKKPSSHLGLWDQFDYLPTNGLTLMTRLLEYDPNQRWDATEALRSNYFTTDPLPATKMPKF
jgi:serine/threonine protein kinase